MSFGIYKQGQGYWVRVMTAAFIGVLIISAAAWGWGQAGTIRLPARTWSFSISNVQGQARPGDTVELFKYDDSAQNAVEGSEELINFGTAIVESYAPGKGATAVIVVGNFENNDVRDKGNETMRISAGPADSPTLAAQVKGPRATPIYPIEYLQSVTAGAIMLIGAICLYIFVGAKKGTVEFLIATDGEMKKVNWTTYREVKGSTIVVIVATFLIAGFLFGVDTLFAKIFSAIGVLER